jgi:geranylgeranyl diphosphate synthase type I
MLVHASYLACDGDPRDPRLARVGAAVELLHSFALLHDDVMDGADTRRGRPSFHRSMEGEHRRRGWRGEPRRFGEGVAVLAGDLAHVYADSLLLGLSASVQEVWRDLRIEVTMGQVLDLDGTAAGNRDPRRASVVAEHKTGRYTVERPLHLGAALAERLEAAALHLTAYGRPLGTAFQYRDDLLGAIGDPQVIGKPVGDDLRDGKPTLLLALAHDAASPAEREVLARVGRPTLSDDDVIAIQEVLRRCGAVDSVERTILSLRDRAIESIRTAPLTAEGIERLIDLADTLVLRER